MPISLYTNIASLGAQIRLNKTQDALNSHMGHLASGLRVAEAKDDAAGMGISTLFGAYIRSYTQADRNASDGISMLQVAEGSLNEIHGSLVRMRELAVQSANGTYSGTDRNNIVVEVAQLQSEITRIANTTRFGNIQMLNAAATVTLQVDVLNSANDRIDVVMSAADATTLKVDTVSVATQMGARAALDSIDTAIASVSSARASLGALQNRLSVARSNDQMARYNLSAATSRIRDLDVAQGSADLARTSVLMQAGVAVLAQANQAPQAALALIR